MKTKGKFTANCFSDECGFCASCCDSEFKSDEKFMRLFADKYPDGKGPSREYFFNILNTLYPDYLQ